MATTNPKAITLIDGEGGGGTPSGDYIPTAQKGQPNGVASLNLQGKVPSSQLPPLGEGGGSIAVLEYDSTDPVNQIAEQFTLADFAPVDESAVIVGNTFKPNPDSSMWLNTTVGVPYPQDIQYCAVKLNNVPTSGSISVDYSNHDSYCIALATIKANVDLSLTYLVDSVLFGYFDSTQNQGSSFDFNIFRNRKYESIDYPESKEQTLEYKWSTKPLIKQSRQAKTDILLFEDVPNPAILTYETYLDVLLRQIGVDTVEELIQYAKDNGFYTPELETHIANAAKQPILFNEAMGGSNQPNFVPTDATDTYLIICPNYNEDYAADRAPLLLDAEWVANVEVTVTKVTSWKVPELTENTYLKINGTCELLGHSLTTGDTLYVYENGTKALKFRG